MSSDKSRLLVFQNGPLETLQDAIKRNVFTLDLLKKGLLVAAEHNTPECLLFLVEKLRYKWCVDDEGGETALHTATRGNKVANIEILVKSCFIDINVKDRYGNTPLHWGVTAKSSQAVKSLLSMGASVASCNKEGLTPSDELFVGNDPGTDIADIFTQLGHGRNVLYSAIGFDRSAFVMNFLQHHQVPDSKQDLLELALYYRKPCVASSLIESGVLCPVDEAVRRGTLGIVRLLIDCGAPESRKAQSVHNAISRDNPQMLQLLMAHGFPIDNLSVEDGTALQRAVDSNSLRCLSFLLKSGHPVRGVDPSWASDICLFRLIGAGFITELEDLQPWNQPESSIPARFLLNTKKNTSLSALCRKKIRECANSHGTNIVHVTEHLGLPESIKRFLCFGEEMG